MLEIVLALAILAGALAALGEVMRLGDQSANLARDETQAELLADSVMAELLAGARPIAAVSEAAFDLAHDPPWVYSIALEPTPYSELVAVRVRVSQQLAPELQPAQCELVRWMLHPDFVTAQLNAQQTATASDSAGSSPSNGSNAGGGGGGQNGAGGPNPFGG